MKIKNIITVTLLSLTLAGISIYAYLKPPTPSSDTERRNLAQFPEISMENILSGKFMKAFEDYTLDQFPFRDTFRGIKAVSEKYAFLKKDNNDIYTAQGHLSKIEYPLDYNMLDYASNKFNTLRDNYFKSNENVYFCMVPDKNYFLAEKNGYLHMDYEDIEEYMQSKMPYAEFIDIKDTLDINDYYRTDTHWKQEMITETAARIAEKLDAQIPSEYKVNTLEQPFYGVYCGQYALKTDPDEIKYLTNDMIDRFVTIRMNQSGQFVKSEIYDMEKADSKDPYEVFLSGAVPVQAIQNPMATNKKQLIIFRDSFAASITPLIAQGYSRTILIDIRYIQSGAIGDIKGIDYENADILFMYSSMVLNSSTSLN